MVFRDENYYIDFADSFDDALSLHSVLNYDLIISDYYLEILFFDFLEKMCEIDSNFDYAILSGENQNKVKSETTRLIKTPLTIINKTESLNVLNEVIKKSPECRNLRNEIAN